MKLDDLREPVAAYLARCVRAENGCLVNPGITGNNYGEIRTPHGRMTAHRAVAALVAGRLPTDDEVARHSCDNRRCAEAAHVALGTQSQNIGDIYERSRRLPGTWPRGEERPQAALDETTVCEMRRLARDGVALWELVDRFGFGYSPTRMAVRGETWAHVTAELPVVGRRNKKPNPRAYRLTRQDEAARAAELVASGLSLAEVGRQLGVSRATAWSLTQAARWHERGAS